MVYAASFRPPTVASNDAATSGQPCPPAWILLDTLAYIADRDNATRAEALTSTGQPIAVSFFAVEPPGISHFCVHCPGLKDGDFADEPRVVHSTGHLALLKLSLTDGPTSYDMDGFATSHAEYFIYRARRHGRPQSLEPLPGLHCHLSKLTALASIVVMPCGSDGEHFVLAAFGFTFTSGNYDFHVFRSKPGAWTEKEVGQAELGSNMVTINSNKVITLGGGEIGWVDLWHGILVCNLLDEDPVFRVILLPNLLPATHVYRDSSSPLQFRDVICVDGSIKFVEIEYCRRRIVREIPDVSKLEVLHDQDLTVVGGAVQTYKDTYKYTGWRMVTWNRTVSSDCWRRGTLVHVDDVVVDDPRYSVLLPELVEKDSRKALQAGFPTLCMDGTDVVYFKSKVSTRDRNAWVVAVDTRKKTVVGVAPFSDERSMYANPNYITCAL